MATEDSTRGIAAEWWEELREFRTTPAETRHRRRGRLGVHRQRWGEEYLLILPGGAMVAEAGFTRIPALEDRYRVIAPSSDGVTPGLGSTRSAAPGTLPG